MTQFNAFILSEALSSDENYATGVPANGGCGYFCSLEDLPSYEEAVQLDVACTFTRQDGDVNQNKYQDVKCRFKMKVYYLRYQLQLTSLMPILASISYGYLYIASRFSISCSKFNYLVTVVHNFCYKNCAKFPKCYREDVHSPFN